MKNLTLILSALMVTLTACNGGGGASKARTTGSETFIDVAPEMPGQPSETLIAAPLIQEEQITLKVYTMSKTEAPINGWINKTFTASGSCVEIEEKTFCWSDGLKVVAFNYNNFDYRAANSYFNLHIQSGNQLRVCSNACLNDYMESPKLVTTQLLQKIPAEKIQEIFNHGSISEINCSLDGNDLKCGNLTFTGVQ